MKWKAIAGAFCSLVASALFAQTKAPASLLPQDPPHASCYSDEFYQHRLLADPQLVQRTNTVNNAVRNYLKSHGTSLEKNAAITIPVVVYVVHNNGPENISDNQVLSQINVLNSYFDPYGIRFCMATMNGSSALPGTTTPGIIRINSAPLTDLDATTEHAALAATSALPSDRYLRIWVVRDINNGTATGFSILPDVAPPALDGVVMDYNAFGDVATCGCTTLSPNTDDGKILVHEVGHYLGLYHTFNGGCAGMNLSNCDSEGDLVCDTPPVASPNSGCSANNSCNETPDLPDHINNYMDYTNENCLNSFTNGQKTRMHAMISLYRSNLVSSANHSWTGINCNGGLLPGFTASSFAPCVGTTVTFTASAISGAAYSWDFGDGSTGSGQTVTHTYSAVLNPGSVILTVSNGSSSASAVQPIFVENCAPIQNSEAHWYFYNRKSLDFSSGTPVYDNSAFANNTMATADQLNVQELSATQSDANGNLLFYTDGVTIWNASHTAIAWSLHGHHSSMNGVIIVPDPANNGQYYVFTSDVRSGYSGWNRGLKYTKVLVSGTTAMAVPGQQNVPVVYSGPGIEQASGTGALITGENLSAVRHNGGYWLIGSTLVNNTQECLVVFNVTPSGISFHQLTVVKTLTSPYMAGSSYGGPIQVSPDGKNLVFCPAYWGSADFIFDFDRCSGTVSNQRELPAVSMNSNCYEFSPDSKLLYGTRQQNVFQIDLQSCPLDGRVVGTIPTGDVMSMQRGPDNKIYGALWQTSNMITIHRPNNLATASAPNACQFTPNGPVTPNGLVMSSGLPNMIDANSLPAYTNTITASSDKCNPVCNTYKFSGNVCAGSYSWNFGDPASGSANISFLPYPVHTFSAPGTYTVTLTADGVTTTSVVSAGVTSAITGSLSICPVTSMTGNYTASIPSGYTASWSVSGGTISGLSNQPDVTVNWTSLPGSVTLTLTNSATGCIAQSTVSVTQNCPGSCVCSIQAYFDYLLDTKTCEYSFDATYSGPVCAGTVSYNWDFGDGQTSTSSSPVHTFTSTGTFPVCLTITYSVNGQTCSDQYCREVDVNCTPSCDCKDMKPEFKYKLGKNCLYTFEGMSGATGCEAYTEYFWDFGDGTTSYGNPAGHVYTNPGLYEVCLKVTIYDENGNVICSEGVCHKINVKCKGDCKCSLKPSFTIQNSGNCKMKFTGYSGSPCANIESYTWYVNGSGPYSGQILNYQFDVNTSYEVCLYVKGYSGGEKCEGKVCEYYFYTDCYTPFKSIAAADPQVTIFPNPASSQVTVNYTSAENEELKITLRLADGRKISETAYPAKTGEQQFTLDIPESVSGGFIFIEIAGSGSSYVEKVMILRD